MDTEVVEVVTKEVVAVGVVAEGVVAVDTGVVGVVTKEVAAVEGVAKGVVTVAMGGPKVDTKQDGRHNLSFHRGEKATRALIQPDPMSAGSLSKLSSFSVSRSNFQSAAKGFLNINCTTLDSFSLLY